MKTARLLLALGFAAATATAQTAPLPDAPQPQPKKQRILWLVPAYDVVNVHAQVRPLTPREKFRLFADSTFDRFTIVSAAFDAGINQALDNPHGYGQGAEGYGKRYGAAIGDKLASDFFKIYALPSLFRQDPRYFALTGAEGASKGKRIRYAISRAFITRGDNGNRQFNASGILGNAASAALTNAWYPPEDREAGTTLARFGTRLGVDIGGNILKEFSSELWGMVRKKKR